MINDPQYYKQWLHYSPDTGEFTWKKSSSKEGYHRETGQRAEYLKNGVLYIKLGPGEQPVRAHRLAYLFMTGGWPVEDIYHVDGNKENNCWGNLETRTEHTKVLTEGRQEAGEYDGPVLIGGTWVTG
jgi:hypothetical protein